MSFFRSRYTIEGVYFLDEPETALSPLRQLEFTKFLSDMGRDGHAQFIIATHSPLLLSCPNAAILSFERTRIAKTAFLETEHYRVYRDFILEQIQGRGRRRITRRAHCFLPSDPHKKNNTLVAKKRFLSHIIK